MNQVVGSRADRSSKYQPMANRNIRQDSLLPHLEIRDPLKSLSAANQVQAKDNPHQPPRNTTTTNSMGIGRLLSILPLDQRPIPASARLGIAQPHQLIDIHSIDPNRIRTRTRSNPNRLQHNPIQLRIMKMNQRITSKITLNKDGLCSGIGSYQVKARDDQKQLQGIIPFPHSLRQQSQVYQLPPNY